MAELTARDRAELRLAAWKATEGWGTTEPTPAGASETERRFPLHKPLDWDQRLAKAEALFAWMMRAGDGC